MVCFLCTRKNLFIIYWTLVLMIFCSAKAFRIIASILALLFVSYIRHARKRQILYEIESFNATKTTIFYRVGSKYGNI